MTNTSSRPGQELEPSRGTVPPVRASLVFLLAVALLVVFIRVRLAPVPLERDEGEYAYAAQLWLQGVPPFVEVYTMKMPGIYAAYAVVLALFGQSPAGIHLGLMLVNAGCTALVYVAARRVANVQISLLAAAIYAFLSVGVGVNGIFAHATHFVVLFALMGLSLLPGPAEDIRLVRLFASGLSFGCAFMMKQHGAPYLVFAGAYLLGFWWFKPEIARFKRATGMALFSGGVFLPFLVMCFVVWRAGVFDTFWFWTFDYARAYIGQTTAGEIPGALMRGLKEVAWGTSLLWLLALAGLAAAAREKGGGHAVIALFAAALVAVSPGFYFRGHYFILMLPVIALLSAQGADFVVRAAPETWRSILVPVVAGAGILQGVLMQADFFFFLSPIEVSRRIYGANPFPESIEIARYLKERTHPEDRIGILGSEPQICFYSSRRSATPFAYMYPLTEDHPFAADMQAELIRDFETRRPVFIVYVPIPLSWGWMATSDRTLAEWIPRFLSEHYEQVGLIEISSRETQYSWHDAQTRRHPRSTNVVYVLKRKDFEVRA